MTQIEDTLILIVLHVGALLLGEVVSGLIIPVMGSQNGEWGLWDIYGILDS